MTCITIPPAALEAGARAAHNQWRHECAVEADEPVENWREWDEIDEWEQYSFRAQARAAFEAMVKNWDGSFKSRSGDYAMLRLSDALILPLMENPDAEA